MKKVFTLKYWYNESCHAGKLKEVSEVFRQVKTMETLEENTRSIYMLLIINKFN